MLGKESAAKIAFWIGALALLGTVMNAGVGARPATTLTTILLMVPYIYIQVRKGASETQANADAS